MRHKMPWKWRLLSAMVLLGSIGPQLFGAEPDVPAFIASIFPDGNAAPAAEPPPRVIHVSEAAFNKTVAAADVPLVVDFYADWCGPCKRFAPDLADFARQTAGVRVLKVNVDESPRLAERCGVEALPCLLVIKRGKITARYTGVPSKSQLRAMLAR